MLLFPTPLSPRVLQRNDPVAPARTHDGGDPTRSSISHGPKGVVFEVRISFGRARLAMAENFANEVETIPT